MPTYNYDCTACGPFEAVRRIAERDALCQCPACGAVAIRSAVSMPDLQFRSGPKSAGQRSEQTNAGATHHSEQGRYGGMQHLANCACCPPVNTAKGAVKS